MSTVATILGYARAQGHTDSNGISDTNGISWTNDSLNEYHRLLIKKGVDASQVQEAILSLTLSANNLAVALWPTDLLLLKELEVSFSGTSLSNYITAQQVDVSNLPQGISINLLRSTQSTQNPQFDDRGDWFEVFPSANCSAHIFYFLKPTEYVATTDVLSYPETIDFRIIGKGVLARYYYYLKDFLTGDVWKKQFLTDVEGIVETTGRGSQQPLQSQSIPWTGFEF